MTVAEAKALEADIAEQGIQVPLDITAGGVVLDGRHRLQAALALGLEQVPVRVVGPKDEIEFMYRVALLRRNLTAAQRVLMVLERDECRAARANGARRKQANLRNSGLDVAALPHRGRSRALVADQAGAGERTVQDVIKAVGYGDPGLLEQLWTGDLSAQKAAKEIVRRERYAAIGEAPPLPEGLFDLIYADPPWPLDSSVKQHYPVMSTAEIAALPVPAADSAVLFLWEVTSLRADTNEVLDAWGFIYKSELVWVKPSIVRGNYVRNRHEKLLIATRGNYPTPTPKCRHDSVVSAPRGRHSEKPAVFYEIIEQMYPHARRRLELFARGKARAGWTIWGNEAAQ